MIVTNLKLHHDWRKDWVGAHMRRVGNNWRITLHMRYKKEACGEVLECMVLHGTVNLDVSLIYRLKDAARGNLRQKMKQSSLLKLYRKFNAANLIHSSLCRYATKRTHRRASRTVNWTLLPVHWFVDILPKRY